jgi:uncharacterized membrane protein
MTIMESNRMKGDGTERTALKLAWEGEIYGAGMFEALAEKYPELADKATAVATMEWLNVHLCEEFGHARGMSVSVELAEKLGREGAKDVEKHSIESLTKVAIAETPAMDKLYEELGKHASSPELKDLADNLIVHEPAMRDWLKSEADGHSDGAEQVFAYLERHGISREQAVTPRKVREGYGGDTQHLVLAFFASEDLADEAAMILRDWDGATEHIKLDGIGVLVKDDNGEIKDHKLGRRAGKKGMGIGVALGVIAAIPTGGLSLLAGAAGGAVGGGVIGEFFHKGLKLTDDDLARIGSQLDTGHAAVGVLARAFETEAVAAKLAETGGSSPHTIPVADVKSAD